ncbi:sensor domain-containing diguanylate cyclase [Paracidovorax citrulli]|uniref:Diguanylate cyclase with PAS/PAC sensor n=3 Tax=Pseudomonadota TaxID=1224 RepID=A1TKB6_PARC0|nr:sensor domain-containing diguanylate cyclase [Paracidovorax citrulli]ABM31404.1 diguanylate cyclase with PAS/PAC sensor [Paracidovorax citrulli AAC00-1]ATG95483.1 GGDEF domain-containing protein [Paracidovorax citrulli]MVT29449.1 diguanylate cyclase [Paracidovorax citrulli]MVT38092.1 diguanylate cyclase [Paracidovorax citrulli]PVY65591.1 diguanylate cyclase (GGDEF)-like protein [Paracidovorax citrulli]
MDFELTATLLDSLGIAMCVFDAEERTVVWNASFLRFFPEHEGHVHAGEPYADNLRRFYQGRLPPEDLPHIDRFIADGLMRNRLQTRPYVFQHLGRWLRVAAVPVQGGHRIRVWQHVAHTDGDPGVPAAEIQPVLPASGTRQMLEDLGEAAAVLDDEGRILYANDLFVTMHGLASREALAQRTYVQIVRQLWDASPDAHERLRRAQDVAAALHDAAFFEGAPFEVPLPGGRWMRVTMNRSAGGQNYALHTDISAVKRNESELRAAELRARESEEQLRVLAEQLRTETHHDVLTGLPNRRTLGAKVQELSAQPGSHALLFIDLDGFKAVNDEAGHAAGDDVLCQVADRLRRCVRGDDVLVRLGGDEFVVLLRHCDRQKALGTGLQIVDTLRGEPFHSAGRAFRIGASVGVRLFGTAQEPVEKLMADADAACYAAKRGGRGRVEMAGAGSGPQAPVTLPCASPPGP